MDKNEYESLCKAFEKFVNKDNIVVEKECFLRHREQKIFCNNQVNVNLYPTT